MKAKRQGAQEAGESVTRRLLWVVSFSDRADGRFDILREAAEGALLHGHKCEGRIVAFEDTTEGDNLGDFARELKLQAINRQLPLQSMIARAQATLVARVCPTSFRRRLKTIMNDFRPNVLLIHLGISWCSGNLAPWLIGPLIEAKSLFPLKATIGEYRSYTLQHWPEEEEREISSQLFDRRLDTRLPLATDIMDLFCCTALWGQE